MQNESFRQDAVLYGLAVAILVFCAAVLEALVFPGAYRAVALVDVSAKDGASASLGDPVRLSRIIEEATLDGPLLEELSRSKSETGTSSVGATPAALLSVRRDLEISSADARVFQVSLTAASVGEAERLCDLVVRRVLERAPGAVTEARRADKGPAILDARARAVSPMVRHGWPDGHQRLLILLGAFSGLVMGACATWLRLRAAASEQGVPALQAIAPAPALSSATSPAATLPLAPADTRGVSQAPVITPRMPAMAGSRLATEGDAPPITERVAPMAPAQAAVPLPVSNVLGAERSYTPAGLGAPAVPMPRRRSTLILGSPILASPPPPRPTPTSIAKPSSVPPASLFSGGSSSNPPPATTSSNPPPARISSRPPPPSLRSPSSRPFERARGRYSYVSTPVPQTEPPKVHEREASFNPDPTLRTELHKPWRRQLFTLGVAQCFVTVVTSVGAARRAKARLAAELALCLAETGHARVLLVEADFPEPEIRALLRVEILEAESVVRQTSTPERTGPWSVLRLKPSLHALVQASPAQPEVVQAERFRECIIALCGSYDFVVLNGPPVETRIPFRSLTGWVDGIAIAAESEGAPGVAETRRLAQGKAFIEVYAAGDAVR